MASTLHEHLWERGVLLGLGALAAAVTYWDLLDMQTHPETWALTAGWPPWVFAPVVLWSAIVCALLGLWYAMQLVRRR